MNQKTQKALQDYNAVRDKLEKLITAGKIDLHKPSCCYSKKEMTMVKQLLEKEKKSREKYYALLSKDLQLGVAELCGAVPASAKKPGRNACGCGCGCKKTGGR
jgi:hypothetical protein